MKILITGGAGFIGYNLYNSLKQEHEIILVDNFSTSHQKENVINLDLSKYSKKIDELIEWSDIIYHFAGSVGVKKIDSEYHGSLMNSININNIVFALCEKYQKKLIFASTSEVYGECIDAKETDTLQISSPEFGRGSYSCAKLMSEFILKSYSFPSVIVRFFNIVGKGQVSKYGMVIPTFLERAKENQDIIIHDSGNQIRSFCDIRDAIEMLKLFLDDSHDNEIFNIGNPTNTYSINELAEIIIKITNSKSKIIHKSTSEIFSKEFFEIEKRSVNTDKIQKFYKPKYSLQDIIESI